MAPTPSAPLVPGVLADAFVWAAFFAIESFAFVFKAVTMGRFLQRVIVREVEETTR
jgi:hypothetical protein